MDPRSKISGLEILDPDPRSKMQDSQKIFLGSTPEILDPAKKSWIPLPVLGILDLGSGSKISGLDFSGNLGS